MKQFHGKAISWDLKDGVIEVALRREPCNEIGTQSLEELEQLASALPALEETAHALISCRAGQDAEEVRHRPSTDLAACHPCKRDVFRRFHCVVKPPSLELAVPPHPVRPFERALCVIVAKLGTPINDV